MPEQPRNYQPYKDEWGTASREGYEDRTAYRPLKGGTKRAGSPLLRSLGGLTVVGGIFWATYLLTSTGGSADVLKPGLPASPVLIVGIGVLTLLLERLFR
ncbi:MAG TPA: hypothetical protein VKZ53_21900 [Candidatus Angelobacter sp.]|nr:hypothetical protein [Candidatus Angelobacter sp.]